MFCCNCGNEIPDEGVFCPECGTKQEPLQVAETPVYEEAPVYQEAPVYEEVPDYEEAPGYEETPAAEAASDPNFKCCERCGATIPMDSRFCPECRARQSGVPMTNSAGNMDAQWLLQLKAAVMKLVTPKVKAAWQKYKKWIVAAAGGVVAVCLIFALIGALVKPNVNLNKYVVLYAEGFEGYGYAQYQFDMEAFSKDFGKDLAKAALDENGKEQLNQSKDSSAAYTNVCERFLAECVDMHLDNEEMLSKGDVITLRWICKDATALNKYGVKLRYKDVEYTVKSLQEANTFDPFEGVEVVFEGVAPYGRAYVEAEPVSDAAREMYYSLDVSDDLANGDKITLTVAGYQENLVQYCIENYGMVPTSLTKELTVSGLDSYVTANAQISSEALKTMQQHAEDVFRARMAQEKKMGESLKGFDYMGNYLMVNKDQEMFGGAYNRLYLVFKVQMNNEYSNGNNKFSKTTVFYWYIGFDNVMVNDKGVTTVNLADYELPRNEIQIDSGVSSGRYSTYSWEYAGYPKVDEIYTDVVAVNVEVYGCESTVKAG